MQRLRISTHSTSHVEYRYLRSSRGSSLAEVGPALFLIFIVGLLPVTDVIGIGINYASTFYLNQLQLREAQKLPKSEVINEEGTVVLSIPDQWRASLLGGMANRDQRVHTQVVYTPVPFQPVGSNQTINFWFVTVSTTVSFRPLLTVPFFFKIPGLGAPINLTVAGRRPVETNRFLNE